MTISPPRPTPSPLLFPEKIADMGQHCSILAFLLISNGSSFDGKDKRSILGCVFTLGVHLSIDLSVCLFTVLNIYICVIGFCYSFFNILFISLCFFSW